MTTPRLSYRELARARERHAARQQARTDELLERVPPPARLLIEAERHRLALRCWGGRVRLVAIGQAQGRRVQLCAARELEALAPETVQRALAIFDAPSTKGRRPDVPADVPAARPITVHIKASWRCRACGGDAFAPSIRDAGLCLRCARREP